MSATATHACSCTAAKQSPPRKDVRAVMLRSGREIRVVLPQWIQETGMMRCGCQKVTNRSVQEHISCAYNVQNDGYIVMICQRPAVWSLLPMCQEHTVARVGVFGNPPRHVRFEPATFTNGSSTSQWCWEAAVVCEGAGGVGSDDPSKTRFV